jgi:hypothetical protein
MSPINTELICPHGRGKDSIESEAVVKKTYGVYILSNCR